MAATFTLDDVRKHNSKDDVWMVIHNKVYNVTTYLEDHPGGSIILREVAGTDATEQFVEIGHSVEATDILEELYVGDLAEEEHAEEVEIFRPTYEKVAMEAAVKVEKATVSKVKKNVRRTIAMSSVIASVGAVGLAKGWWTGPEWALAAVTTAQKPINQLADFIRSKFAQNGSSSKLFWWGVGIATVVELSLTTAATTWALSKFEAQKEFTHFPRSRPAKKERKVAILKIPTNSTSGPAVKPPVKVMDPADWRKFKLVRKVLVSPNVYHLVFALPHPTDVLGLPTGQHVALRALIDGKSVSRSYTPVSNNSDLGRVELLIKVYDQGLMTKHLERMEIGDQIEMRGPKGAMQYVPNSYAKEIGMIAGGTGITPMYQLIRAICEDESDKTKISLLYANNTEADILLREELDGFVKAFPDKLSVQYVLGQADENWTGLRGFVTADMIKDFLPPAADTTKMLLCGPPPMVAAMSKNLVSLGFTAPGTLSKATDQVFLF
ncbi:hypothetical protein GE21DRAFT_29 [Neurospora crassa]|uniref:NADH-cytochrome b5 reductase 1 n=1 Tax=Neurospora crassa (strain ATCC 24698 / 74-OR23-1A / CBS 708.71 / DSM 1257 / FGSC 987) TaxID=367110 RepID=Q7SGM3_NEUCR|nr:cytochrome b5 [Neurospora crassa OR74A]EAA35955.1 cytochrome b5 [Neurospora crassa OR74A]KHE80638.1 hypothetical protein GE21DRAFT_29 [Neurospora crassa]|eukprot:XP_965191.1 cytochrome b5 [Neurospora crassa OR74A]